MSSNTNTDIAIHCENLGKQYQLGEQSNIFTLMEHLAHLARSVVGGTPPPKQRQTIWALKDLSFELSKGTVMGVIGKNGSGKSTLFKLLSRITPPTRGSFWYRGTISSLLEVGTGFKQELTGRDNIFLNGTTLGLKRRDILNKLDEIVEFAEIGKFLDTPVKRYSSGMYVRLAFAVAAHLEPDILLIDEVLAVGDLKFQQKCLKKMGSVASEGRTVMFISHNMQAVTQLCHQAILLDGGDYITSGPVSQVVECYQQRMQDTLSSGGTFTFPPSDKPAQITSVQLGSSPDIKQHFDIMEDVPIEVTYQVDQDFDDMMLCLNVSTLDGNCVLFSRELDGVNYELNQRQQAAPKKKGQYRATVTIPAPLLNAGHYELIFFLLNTPEITHDCKRNIPIEITDLQGSFSSCVSNAPSPGLLATPLSWKNEKNT